MKNYFEDDRAGYQKFNILSEKERQELFAIYHQKEKQYQERIKDMTKEERIIECENFDLELEQIFEEFKQKSLNHTQNTKSLASA